MSRRDTIIVAILVNAGLLMVLFATATKSKTTKAEFSHQIVQEVPLVEKQPQKQVAAATTLDQLLFSGDGPLMTELPLEEEIILATQELEEPTEYLTITVKQGDALEKIARANNTTIAQIVAVNELSSTQLQLGQRLKIPTGTNQGSSNSPISKPAPMLTEEYYTVKEGDNPWLIASKSHVKLEELLRMNNLNATTAKKLRPGDRLRIR